MILAEVLMSGRYERGGGVDTLGISSSSMFSSSQLVPISPNAPHGVQTSVLSHPETRTLLPLFFHCSVAAMLSHDSAVLKAAARETHVLLTSSPVSTDTKRSYFSVQIYRFLLHECVVHEMLLLLSVKYRYQRCWPFIYLVTDRYQILQYRTRLL